jgi:OFA family oxalate/formate antiporter-like MFS transporter
MLLYGTAGKSLVSQAAPMAEEITGVGSLVAAGMVGILSLANGARRFLWGWLSDLLGRRWVFVALFLVQAGVFSVLPLTASFLWFTILASVAMLCYGGGLGTLPAAAADAFGTKNAGTIYGLLHTAGGLNGLLGPMLIAGVRQATGAYTDALSIMGAIMLASVVIAALVRPPGSLEGTAPAGETQLPARGTA